MSQESQYYCIFQSSIRRTVDKDNIKNVLSVSGCSCYGHCPQHTYHIKEGIEGLSSIQEECIGHRLTNANKNTKTLPNIQSGENITHQQYNILRNIINTELDERKKSPLYKNAVKETLPAMVNSFEHIKQQQILKLNNFIAQQQFYKDTVSQPDLPTPAKKDAIKSVDIHNSTNAIRALLNDCICYSDCNSYSTCNCYGNCNHY